MKKQKIILIIAVFISLVPFIGVPNLFQDALVSILGLVIIAILILGKYSKKDMSFFEKKKGMENSESLKEFDESEPEIFEEITEENNDENESGNRELEN